MLSALFLALVCFIVPHIAWGRILNVALHAQAVPTADQIVGSVITTDGLRNAFLQRNQGQGRVQVFYPSSYQGYFNQSWDLLLIEGWFPSIHGFLQLSRLVHPKMPIIFLCLDPAYPGIESVLSFHVDGVMTNSKQLLGSFQPHLPTAFLMLAADPEVMRPIQQSRTIQSMYIGAGGFMLQSKPELAEMLSVAASFGLVIHGKAWESTPFAAHWHGILPKDDIAKAYGSAEIVLASTIATQDAVGMANNRLFEALACGSIVITKRSAFLQELFGNHVLFYDNNLSTVMEYVLALSPEARDTHRAAVRQFILKAHTWQHRVVDILAFASSLTTSSRMQPKMLWVVSKELREHGDVQQVINRRFREHLGEFVAITEMDQSEWIARSTPCTASEQDCLQWLAGYDVLFMVIQPFDALDQHTRSLPGLLTNIKKLPQRRAAYILPGNRSGAGCEYDLVFFRDFQDKEQLKQAGVSVVDVRFQHAFGVTHIEPEALDHEVYVVVCFLKHQAVCTTAVIQQELMIKTKKQVDYELILVGGSLQQWTIPAVQLPRTHLIAGGSLDSVDWLLAKSRLVVFMNGPDHPNGEEIALFLLACHAKAEIYLVQHNTHLLALASVSCMDWDDAHLRAAVNTGLQKLFGMAISSSTVATKAVAPSASLLAHFAVPQQRVAVLLELEYTDFLIGRDGVCCFVTDPNNLADQRCLIRSFDRVLLSFPVVEGFDFRVITVSLRGTAISNDFYLFNITVPVASSGTDTCPGKVCLENEQQWASSTAYLPMDGGIAVSTPSQHTLQTVQPRAVINTTSSLLRDVSPVAIRSNGNLAAIGKKHGTDKMTHHGYHRFYPRFLEMYRSYPGDFGMLEIGIEYSRSLRTWREYLPQLFIYGIDIGVEKEEERLMIGKVDQSDLQQVKQFVDTQVKHPLLLVIDDGSHIPEHQLLCFDYLFQHLCWGGTYIIEDIETSYWTKARLYGYPAQYGYKSNRSVIEVFKHLLDDINREFLTPSNLQQVDQQLQGKITEQTRRLISTVTFGQNCIVIVKKTEEEVKLYGDRKYIHSDVL